MFLATPRCKAVSLCLLLVLCGVCTGAASAQTVRGSFIRDDASGANPFRQLRDRSYPHNVSTARTASLALEGSVDPDHYVVGPGDVFTITIGGSSPLTYTQPVSPDGYLILPDAGGIRVAGRSLTEVRTSTVAALRSRFQNVQTDIALVEPRRFMVHVSGAVPLPGRYPATPVDRVSDVLSTIFADTTTAPVANPAYQPSLRSIQVRRQDGSTVSVDLLRYFSTGDTEHNPYLRDGDVLSVSAYNPNLQSVYVDGAVPFPDAYPYRNGDTVQDVLALAAGPDAGAAEHVRLTRQHSDGSIDVRVLRSEELRSEAPIPIQPLDHVYVIPEERRGGSITIEGWVTYPGTYPIEPGRSTLHDVVTHQAGGLREEALARGAYIIRRMLPARRGSDGAMSPELAPAAGLYALPDTSEIFNRLRLADLDFLGRSYLEQELRLQNRIPVNLDETLRGTAPPVFLQDGDRLVVPRDFQTVYVFGQVTRPGPVTYHPGQSARDYILAAGGPTPASSEAFVIEAGTGRYLPASTGSIQSGDMIFVGRQENIATSAELQRIVFEDRRLQAERRFQARQTLFQTISSTVALISGAATIYYLVRD